MKVLGKLKRGEEQVSDLGKWRNKARAAILFSWNCRKVGVFFIIINARRRCDLLVQMEGKEYKMRYVRVFD